MGMFAFLRMWYVWWRCWMKVPPHLILDPIQLFDSRRLDVFGEINGVPPEPDPPLNPHDAFARRLIYDLPTSKGGLGLRLAEHYAAPAYLAASVNTAITVPHLHTDYNPSNPPPFIQHLHHTYHILKKQTSPPPTKAPHYTKIST